MVLFLFCFCVCFVSVFVVLCTGCKTASYLLVLWLLFFQFICFSSLQDGKTIKVFGMASSHTV